MRPQIVTASADSTHISSPSPMSEMHDNGDVAIHHIGELAASAATAIKTSGQEEISMARQLWNGLVEDLFGRRKAA